MSNMDDLAWRTSTYTNGDNCVEVAPSAGWRTSTYTVGDRCVEVASGDDPRKIYLRDTKDRTAGVIAFGVDDWTRFVQEVKGTHPSNNSVVVVTTDGSDTLVQSLDTGVEFRFFEGEWKAYVAGVLDGEFDLPLAAVS
jgi:hypothetical protein